MKEGYVNGECLLSLTRHELKKDYGMPREMIRALYEEMFLIDPLFKVKMQERFERKRAVLRNPKDGAGLQPSVKVVLGDVIVLKDKRQGRVCFIGNTSFGEGQWYGLELKETVGEHDGQWKGKRYYKCAENKGLFVKRTHVAMVISTSKTMSPKSRQVLCRKPGYYQEMEEAMLSDVEDGGSWELSSSTCSSSSSIIEQEEKDAIMQVPAASNLLTLSDQEDLIVETSNQDIRINKPKNTFKI